MAVQGDLSGVRIHWQSTVNELPDLQTSMYGFGLPIIYLYSRYIYRPQAIAAYETLASDAGLSTAQINQLQTADASPNGGHWLGFYYIYPRNILTSQYSEFDQKDFVTGVQLLTDNYADILSGNAALNGVTVTNVGFSG